MRCYFWVPEGLPQNYEEDIWKHSDQREEKSKIWTVSLCIKNNRKKKRYFLKKLLSWWYFLAIWTSLEPSQLHTSERILTLCKNYSEIFVFWKYSIYNHGLHMYRTRAIITRLYTFYPLLEVQKHFFKGLCS